MISSDDIANLTTETEKWIADFTAEVIADQANGLDRTADQKKINFVHLLWKILTGFHVGDNLTADEQDLLWQRITCLTQISVKDL